MSNRRPFRQRVRLSHTIRTRRSGALSGTSIAVTGDVQPRVESELIASGRKGDRQALSELFERHYASSVRIARRILGSNDDALDAVQAAYLAAFQHLDEFRGEAAFGTWVTRIVTNQCFAHLRRPERRRLAMNLEDSGAVDAAIAFANRTLSPEDLAFRDQIINAHSNATGELPKGYQEVYTLCFVSGLSVREAARVLGLTVSAAKTRLFRARHWVHAAIGRKLGTGTSARHRRS